MRRGMLPRSLSFRVAWQSDRRTGRTSVLGWNAIRGAVGIYQSRPESVRSRKGGACWRHADPVFVFEKPAMRSRRLQQYPRNVVATMAHRFAAAAAAASKVPQELRAAGANLDSEYARSLALDRDGSAKSGGIATVSPGAQMIFSPGASARFITRARSTRRIRPPPACGSSPPSCPAAGGVGFSVAKNKNKPLQPFGVPSVR